MALPRFRKAALGLMLVYPICVGPLSGTPARSTVAGPGATVREDVA